MNQIIIKYNLRLLSFVSVDKLDVIQLFNETSQNVSNFDSDKTLYSNRLHK